MQGRANQTIASGAIGGFRYTYQGGSSQQVIGISLDTASTANNFDEGTNFSLIVNSSGNFLAIYGPYTEFHDGGAAQAGDFPVLRRIDTDSIRASRIRAGVETTLYDFTQTASGILHRKFSGGSGKVLVDPKFI
jgi:hypothetical protein